MQQDKIALIAPNKDFTLQALDLFSEWGEKIHVAMASKDDVIGIAQQLGERGADALICYAPFDEIIKTTVSIPTVSLRPSILDILRSMQWVKAWLAEKKNDLAGDKLVVGVTGDSIITDAAIVAEALGIRTKVLSQIHGEDMSEIVAVVKEVPDIADNDGVLPEFIANNIPCFPVTIGRESLLKSVRYARELVLAGRGNRVKLEQFKAIMEFTGEGIVAVDGQRRVTYINHTAEKLLKKGKEQVVGYLAATVFPDVNLDDTLRYGQIRNTLFTDGAEQAFACRIVPMIIGGQTIGAVLTIAESPFTYKEKDKPGKDHGERGYKAVYHFDDFITINPHMQETLEAAKSYASVDSTILINGDTGTGKEIIAQSIHNYSQRCQGPFVAVNCAALPESLLESELFGYEYGAFTGARKNGKKGFFEQADQGTIFLDEIGDISLGMQARLLRVIQQREIMRIGGDKVIPVDVGIVAATHRNLPELIEKGLFRRDLYHRLSILQLKLLPLSARQEDIPCLVENISKKLSEKLFKQPLHFSAAAMSVLASYQWPGNVRELEGVIERLRILKKDNVVTADEVRKVLDVGCDSRNNGIIHVPKGTMEEIEKAIIIQVLRETGNQDQTAKVLGISTTTIWRKLKTFQNEKIDCNLQ
ncbi:sigma 54-interacting transcriptional regulator [Sporomusa sp.]|uniref:sigma 54-interacting transcriptional regulator n=1 Tax=Sporomusa sp. TaxID=2078658 RepID=UPI002C128DD0|nr:sigma 54-interacting transcriptional regulator [Sporomusa sp.]HWR45409.1 sigma 54-interacting transcriptional regulator [Sporomusa sp.]